MCSVFCTQNPPLDYSVALPADSAGVYSERSSTLATVESGDLRSFSETRLCT